MGRHSAPDDDESVVEAAATTATLPAVPALDVPTPRGRHAVVDDGDADLATGDAPVKEKKPKQPKPAKPPKPVKEKKPKEPKPAKPPKPAKEKKPTKEKKTGGTRADLRLLRENGAVRARCIGAVLLAFLVYTIVIVVLGKADAYLLWLWVPIVLSGVLVGSVLDLAYRAKSRAEAGAAPKQPTS